MRASLLRHPYECPGHLGVGPPGLGDDRHERGVALACVRHPAPSPRTIFHRFHRRHGANSVLTYGDFTACYERTTGGHGEPVARGPSVALGHRRNTVRPVESKGCCGTVVMSPPFPSPRIAGPTQPAEPALPALPAKPTQSAPAEQRPATRRGRRAESRP